MIDGAAACKVQASEVQFVTVGELASFDEQAAARAILSQLITVS